MEETECVQSVGMSTAKSIISQVYLGTTFNKKAGGIWEGKLEKNLFSFVFDNTYFLWLIKTMIFMIHRVQTF